MIVAFYAEAPYSGKDTCADFAAEWLRARGLNATRDAFAWDGKVVCADALGIRGTREEKIAAIDLIKQAPHGIVSYQLYDGEHVRTSTGQPGRDFIIGLLGDPEKGTGVRGLDEGFWTTGVILRDADANASYGDSEDGCYTLVSDLRFIREAEAVVAADGIVIEVVRPGTTRVNEERVPNKLIHDSIANDGTLEDLRARVESVMMDLVDVP